ncbi:MAG: hypothetical protein FWH41_09655 [Treponema sp.]|nr:hypothetical protein [Treponema sp.]
MTTTYKLNTMELKDSFIDTIRTTYPNQVVEIEIREQDETEFLMSSPAMREKLDRAIKNVNERNNLISFATLEDAVKAAEELNRKQ